MAQSDPSDPHLQGWLLLASPSLLDPHFRRSVVYLSDYVEEEGAIGWVLNRPTGKVVSDLVEELPHPDLAEVPVYYGGPVNPNQLTFASLCWDAAAKEFHFRPQVPTSEISPEDLGSLRAFIGHSGWTKGQLEKELKEKAWILHLPDAQCAEPIPFLWRQILHALGPWYQLAADEPEDLSLN